MLLAKIACSHLGVFKNMGTPKSSILISIINHPLWGTPIFGNIHLFVVSFWCSEGIGFFLIYIHMCVVFAVFGFADVKSNSI